MTLDQRPPVWSMIKEAVDAIGPDTSNVDVRDWILAKYPGTNVATIQAQIVICTVNHESRVHYPENQKVRRAGDRRYDFLFRSGRGLLRKYDPKRDGGWEIAERPDGRLMIREITDGVADEEDESTPPDVAASIVAEVGEASSSFAAENHLRDYLAANPARIEEGMQLFTDDLGAVGVEYATPIGRIDILAVDASGGLVVIELKVGRGSDAVCGQLLRYKSWIKQHIADGRRVRGFIIAERISERLRYALMDVPDVIAKEYDLQVTLRDVDSNVSP